MIQLNCPMYPKFLHYIEYHHQLPMISDGFGYPKPSIFGALTPRNGSTQKFFKPKENPSFLKLEPDFCYLNPSLPVMKNNLNCMKQ